MFLGECFYRLRVIDRIGGPGSHGRAHTLSDRSSRELVAQRLDSLGRGADPGQPGIDNRAGEVGVFREEAIAGVHRVGAGASCHGDQLVGVQISGLAVVALQGIGGVGQADVQGVGVVVGVDGHARQPGLAGGADDADRDLAAVGNQQGVHGR